MKNLKWICILLLFPFFANTQIDVSLQKTLLSPPPFLYGDLISFQLEITNNSNVAVSNIALLETFGCGLTYTGGSISWTLSGNQLTGTVAGPVNPGQSVLVFVDFNLKACLLPDAWLNNASITGYTDALGNNIFNLDNNVLNNSDTAIAPVFDLALSKKIFTPPPYQYEDLLYFEITVFNQGNQTVQNISINDYLPSGVGFMYDPLMNPGWTGLPPTLNRVIPGILLPGDSLKTGIYLTLKRTNGGVRAWVNYSEIDGAQDVNGSPVFDADSTPGSNSITENNVLPGDPDDDNISGGGPLAGEDEDDHDPSGVDIFDLALTKEQASALSSFSYVQEVDLLITIYNQGNIPATNITITDYLGEALVYLNSPKNIGRNWVYDPSTHTASTTYTKVLLPGQSDTLMLDVAPLQYYTKHDSAWTNWAEISSARDAVNNVVTADIDSTPDNINGNDAGSRPDSPSDNAINGDASGTPGDAVAATDEDDHDTHKIQIFDLALRKNKVTPGNFFNPGEDIVFAITVFNQGNVPAKDIVVSDYIPDGYEFFPGGANTGWTGTAPLVKMNIAQVIFPGRDTTIFITLRVKASSIPGAYLNYAEISAARDTLNNNRNDDADSIADDNPNNDNQVLPGSPDDDNVFGNSFIGEDEDDHDVAGIELLCPKPTLTVGIPVCDPGNGTYSVTYYSNVPNVTASSGTVSGNRVSGIQLGTNVVITAQNGADCTQSLTIQSPDNCPGTGGCDYPQLTVGQPVCSGGGFWAVSFSRDIGIIGTTAGTVTGNTIINIPIGTNITVSSSNGFCISRVNVSSPVNCDIPCANSPISISGPVCESNGTYLVNFIINPGSTITASSGTLNLVNGTVTGIASGTNLTLTITTSGCDTRVIVVPAGDCPAGNATIGNFVWHDLNGDGQQSVGEPGISGVVIMLMDQSGNMVAQTTSAANGSYTISNILPGTYFLKFSVPSGFQATFGLIGNPNSDSDVTGVFGAGTTGLFTLSPGQVNNNLDAGFFRCATIGEFVWYDTNRNDIRDNPENGINGLRVNLWRNHFGSWLIWDYTVTGHKPGTASDDGWWQFCAPPGQYYVQVIMPPLGLVQALPNRGNNPNRDSDLTNAFGPGTTNSFVMSSGGSKLDIGAGYYPMAIAGNLVWRDDNLNGLQEASEPKISGVVVEAFDADTHQKVGQSVTDNQGVYEIDYLQKKDVYFRFSVPQGFSPTLPNAGEDHLNSDVDHSFGANTTRKISMESGVFNQNIDMGIAFGILPVTWTDVSVLAVNKGHLIRWTTGSELNVSHFVVERLCNDDKDFSSLPGSVKAKGFSRSAEYYSVTDLDLTGSGDYYYRVKQIDFDGNYSYSKIVHIEAGENNPVSIYPNPAFGSATLEVEVMESSKISVVLFDSNGKFVMQLANDIGLEYGLNQVRMDLSGLTNAVYTMKIDIGNRDTVIRKLIIIK